MNGNEDPRITAIRADELIGRGSCSMVDECMDAGILFDAWVLEQINPSPREAVQWAREQHIFDLEMALNTEPDDSGATAQRLADFRVAMKRTPISIYPLEKRRNGADAS